MGAGRFLAGIAAVIWSADTAKYLLLRRSADKDFAPGIWECVTGRVDQGESYVDALSRETREELGFSVDPLFILGTTHFYRGAHATQNELLGVIFACELPQEMRISLSVEHDTMCWVTFEEAMALLSGNDPSTMWLKRVLQRAENFRNLAPDNLARYASQNSFDLG